MFKEMAIKWHILSLCSDDLTNVSKEYKQIFSDAVIDDFMPIIKLENMDTYQGAVFIVTSMIELMFEEGGLKKIYEKPDYMHLYDNLKFAWNRCFKGYLDGREPYTTGFKKGDYFATVSWISPFLVVEGIRKK